MLVDYKWLSSSHISLANKISSGGFAIARLKMDSKGAFQENKQATLS
jgi:hypothetical protein